MRVVQRLVAVLVTAALAGAMLRTGSKPLCVHFLEHWLYTGRNVRHSRSIRDPLLCYQGNSERGHHAVGTVTAEKAVFYA